jgi:hypothetical protein
MTESTTEPAAGRSAETVEQFRKRLRAFLYFTPRAHRLAAVLECSAVRPRIRRAELAG